MIADAIAKIMLNREARGYAYPAEFVHRCLNALETVTDPLERINVICALVDYTEGRVHG